MTNQISPESYGEFKGNTSAKLEILFRMMTDVRTDTAIMKNDIQDLKDTRTWSVGWLSGVGVLAGLVGAYIKERFFKTI